jgi:nickel-type superoxide dismutase maturation protease
MEPTLRPGDWLLVIRRTVGTRNSVFLRPGRIVVAQQPGRRDLLIVKRAVRREAGGWWLASDNPDAGAVDSRAFGPVPPALIMGTVLLRYRRAARPGS